MNLFSKDKELILKLTNAVLLIWFVGAIVFAFSSIINLIMKEPVRNQTYEEYKVVCYKDETLSEEEQEKQCKEYYKDVEFEKQNRDFYIKKSLYISLVNIVIVGTTLCLLNKDKKKK